ncbi:MAG: hypothetical protein II951_05830 [Bacteroidales bacterium]|jgi:hypothetical protein|nr:hypothetical protein [Bacteroidales bacterium]
MSSRLRDIIVGFVVAGIVGVGVASVYGWKEVFLRDMENDWDEGSSMQGGMIIGGLFLLLIFIAIKMMSKAVNIRSGFVRLLSMVVIISIYIVLSVVVSASVTGLADGDEAMVKFYISLGICMCGFLIPILMKRREEGKYGTFNPNRRA